uniref:LAGLIDADG endonuclease type 2 n=1 Tax=Amanita thiersii TaxID=235537 RepID=A0A5Q0N2S4_9AGAR|nr:LAGLIDADG endonuclease type 2 [Amanita thiersii]QFZ98698.1 LAGLIDADG endonuclease type 2 [Amanita thiersii]
MLTELYLLFYVNGIKTVPHDLSLLTPIALAHWIMQDGARGTSNGLYLCTDSFSFSEVNRLKDYLTERYKIKCTIHKVNGRFRIYILAKYVQTIRELVVPYMHDSMKYKLGI